MRRGGCQISSPFQFELHPRRVPGLDADCLEHVVGRFSVSSQCSSAKPGSSSPKPIGSQNASRPAGSITSYLAREIDSLNLSTKLSGCPATISGAHLRGHLTTIARLISVPGGRSFSATSTGR